MEEWSRAALENLEQGHQYSIRISYSELQRTHAFDLKLETVLSDGTSVFTNEGDIDLKVIFNQNGGGGLVSGRGSFAEGDSRALKPTASIRQELLDTQIKFLDLKDNLQHLQVRQVYLHIRIRCKGLPSGDLGDELGVFTNTERMDGPDTSAGQHNAEASSNNGKKKKFFEFDILVSEKRRSKVEVDFIPIVLACISFFVLMNLYIVRRWHRFVTRAPDPVSPYTFV